MTTRARHVATDQLSALLAEAETALWGRAPGEGIALDPAGTITAFRSRNFTAAELSEIALAAQTLATAAFEAAIGDLADTLVSERRRR